MLNPTIQIMILLAIAGWPVSLLFVFKRLEELKAYIGSLHASGQHTPATPEQIQIWQTKIKTLTPGCAKWRAYKASLESVGAWDGDRH